MVMYLKQEAQVILGPSQEEVLKGLSNILAVPYTRGSFDEEKTKMVLNTIMKKKHLSVLEHFNYTLELITDIGTYKAYTRHRNCSFTIESTCYTKYKALEVIFNDFNESEKKLLESIEKEYIDGLSCPERKKNIDICRDILPQCKAAKVIMTTNIRQWRYIIGLRSDPNDSGKNNELRNLILEALNKKCPILFPLDLEESGIYKIPQLW